MKTVSLLKKLLKTSEQSPAIPYNTLSFTIMKNVAFIIMLLKIQKLISETEEII